MSQPGTLAAALAYVPHWWQETSDPTGLDALLVGWAKACGWKGAGFVWPADGPTVLKTAHPGETGPVAAELTEAARHLRAGEPTVLWVTPGTAGRVYAAVHLAGRPMGLVWADRPAGQPWSEADRAYLVLTARAMEHSPVVAAATGPLIDPERLAQRLADASVIAGRMAHDFDNILTGIMGFADLAGPMLAAGSQPAGFVAEIGKVGQRGIQFTQQLHQLSRGGQVKPTPGSVPAAVAKEEVRLRPTLPTGVRLTKDLPPTLPAVAIETGPLQTVLGHLIANAAEACPPGGLVSVSARAVELTEADAREFLGRVAVGGHLEVAVSDTGTGIKPEVRRRLFAEPFFTTKVRHRGLGLAIAYRILCAHRGGIQVNAVPPPGTGTQARVVLPLASRPAAVTGTTTPPPQGLREDAVRGAGGTISATTVGG
jgi:signal transduction histidine kinase